MTPGLSLPSQGASEEILDLIELLRTADLRLEELLAGEVDTVTDRTGQTILLRRAQQHLRHSEDSRQAAILNALPAHIALLDQRGVIVSVNTQWRVFADVNGFHGPGHAVGLDYLGICDAAQGLEARDARHVAAGIRSVLDGSADNFSFEYPCHAPAQQRWFQMTVTPLASGRLNGAVVMHLNVTEQKRAEERRHAATQLLDSVVENIPVAIHLKSVRDGFRTLMWNKASETIYGVPREDAIGKSVHGIWPVESADRMHASDLEMVADGQTRDFQDRPAPTRDRGEIRMHLRKVALRDSSGDVSHILVVADDITERKRADDELRRSQQHLRHLIDGLGPGMFAGLLTPQGIVVEVNRSPLKAAGLTPEDVLGKPFDQTHWWAHSPHAQQQLREAIVRAAQGEASHYEVRIEGANGQLSDIDFSLRPLRNEAGEVTFLIPSAVVITERKRAEMALQKSEAEFRTLAESVPQIVWVARPDGWMTYFNQHWTDYTGMTREASLGHGANGPIHPDDRAKVQAGWQQAISAKSAYMLECRIRGADGTYRWWLIRATPNKDAADAVVKWVGTCTDIHDLKLAEMEVSRANRDLQRQRTELRVLFDLVPAMIWFKDTHNGILRVNQRVADIAGLSVEQIEGRPSAEIYPADAEKFYAADLEVIRSGIPKLGIVESVKVEAGKELWVQTDKVPYRDESGKVIGIVVMAQDITERKHDQDALRELNADLESRVRHRTVELDLARNQAEEASLAKSDFLAAMSHEIRTPMSGMLGLLELLGLSALDKDQHSTLSVARESGRTLLHIIDDILDFSKIEANRLELAPVYASVREVVASACRMQSPVASRKNVTLHCHVAPEISTLLSFDPLRLGQILNNFLNNAIKFTEQGTVEVEVQLVGREDGTEHLRFVVRDTGIGMSPDQIGRLFQPFVQAGADISARFGGTGLGLVISRRLAELMGGTVEIESEPGRGTTLTFLVGLQQAEAGAQAESRDIKERDELDTLMIGRRSAPSIQEAEVDGTLLLVVDDHPTNRMVLMRQVASLGYAAEVANDGVEAFEAWQSGRFSAVITDCNMPRMDGYALAKAIRQREALLGNRRIPIIACTANALPAATDLCIAAGMDDCMVKPVALAEVCRKLDWWLPLHHIRQDWNPLSVPFANSRSAPAAEGLLDLVLLGEISGGNATAQSAILAEFRRVNDVDAKTLREASAADNFAKAMEFAHRIKGASLMLGATLLSGACARIEEVSAAKDGDGLRTTMAAFETELLRLYNYLDLLDSTRPVVET